MTGFHARFRYQLAWMLCKSLILHCHQRPTSRRFRSFYQVLENERLLLVFLDLDGGDKVSIYLERLPEMSLAIKRRRVVKSLKRERLGERVLFAFDERKRALAVCASAKVF